jgi:hypothetical protein
MANVTPSNARYLALTTYRRDGRPVTCSTWDVSPESSARGVRRQRVARVREPLGVRGGVPWRPTDMETAASVPVPLASVESLRESDGRRAASSR